MNTQKNDFTITQKILAVIVFVATLYFLYIAAFPRLIVTEASYTEYYWFRAHWLIIHVVAGLTATFVGWYQFIPKLRNKNLRRHRIIGKVYFYSVIVAAITASILAYLSPGMDFFGKGSFITITFIWIGTTLMGYIAVRRKNINQHKEWMLRSYVVTFFFTIFVIITRYLPYEFLGVTYEQAIVFVTWFSWAIPLFITEMIIQGKKIKPLKK